MHLVTMKSIKFKTLLNRPDPASGWHFVQVKAKIGEKFEKKDGGIKPILLPHGGATVH